MATEGAGRARTDHVGSLDELELLVDGETVATVGRSREPDGHTAYDVTAAEFEAAVRSVTSPASERSGER